MDELKLIEDAGKFIQWGFRPKRRPSQSQEYQQLVNRYQEKGDFRQTVKSMATGLDLRIVKVDSHGIVLAPYEASVFAYKPSDFRPGAGLVENRLKDGIIIIAIAATIFPNPRDIDDDEDIARPPVTVDEMEVAIRDICKKVMDNPDVDKESSLGEAAYLAYHRAPSTVERADNKPGKHATTSSIRYCLNSLNEQGCFTIVEEDGVTLYRPTHRFQLLVKDLAYSDVFQLVEESIQAKET